MKEFYIKNKWVSISQKEKQLLKRNLLDLINKAYASQGMQHYDFKTTQDILNSDYVFWKVLDWDDDEEIDAEIVGKKKFGTKISAIGHDMQNKSKTELIKKHYNLLKKSGYWAEVSGKPAQFFLAAGVNVIKNKNIVNLLLYPKKIKWLGDGWYERKIGDEIKKKIIIGIPKI